MTHQNSETNVMLFALWSILRDNRLYLETGGNSAPKSGNKMKMLCYLLSHFLEFTATCLTVLCVKSIYDINIIQVKLWILAAKWIPGYE